MASPWTPGPAMKSPATPPVNFLPTQRTRSLLANSSLHVPSSCRLSMVAAVVQSWQGMDRGTWKTDARRSCCRRCPALGAAAEVAKTPHALEKNAASGTSCDGSRNTSCATADQARRRNAAAWTASPLRSTEFAGLGLSPILSFKESVDWSRVKEFLTPPPWTRKPTEVCYWWHRWLLLRQSGTSLLLAGTSGIRAEHITNLLNVRHRVDGNKIYAALSALFCRISAGPLPPGGSCVRGCWQRKKNGKVRPIKMSELLRSPYAEQPVIQHQVVLGSEALRMNWWSISLSGAYEALCHWRVTIIARKRNFVFAEVVFQAAFQHFPGDLETERSTDSLVQSLSGPFWAPSLSLSLSLSCAAAAAPARLQPSLVCARLAQSGSDSWRFSSPRWCFWKTWHSVTLGSTPSGLVALITADEKLYPPRFRGPTPARALPDNRCGSILLSQRGPTSLAVKSCPLAPPKLFHSSRRRSDSGFCSWASGVWGRIQLGPRLFPAHASRRACWTVRDLRWSKVAQSRWATARHTQTCETVHVVRDSVSSSRVLPPCWPAVMTPRRIFLWWLWLPLLLCFYWLSPLLPWWLWWSLSLQTLLRGGGRVGGC